MLKTISVLKSQWQNIVVKYTKSIYCPSILHLTVSNKKSFCRFTITLLLPILLSSATIGAKFTTVRFLRSRGIITCHHGYKFSIQRNDTTLKRKYILKCFCYDKKICLNLNLVVVCMYGVTVQSVYPVQVQRNNQSCAQF